MEELVKMSSPLVLKEDYLLVLEGSVVGLDQWEEVGAEKEDILRHLFALALNLFRLKELYLQVKEEVLESLSNLLEPLEPSNLICPHV